MTANSTPETIPNAILEQAADWVLDIQADPEQVYTRAFSEWLYADTRHLYAFEETAKTFELALALPTLSPVAQRQNHAQHEQLNRSPFTNWMFMAASVAVFALLLFAIVPRQLPEPAPLILTSETGKVTEFTLPDTSVLHLDTNSVAEAQVTQESRHVRLIKGRLFADIAKDPLRRFSVSVDGATSFTALGTAYAVAKSEANWTLEVYEGVVGVASSLVSHPPVEAGWGLRYTRQTLQLFKLPQSLTPGLPDWQQMQVKFHDEPLASAVKKINQYTDKRIRLEHSSLAEILISGVFDLRVPRQFAYGISELTGAEVTETDKEIVLSLHTN